jgi:starch synthase
VVKVALITPELHALVRRTNLAGIAQELAKGLQQAGADVRVFLPRTREVSLEALTEVEQVARVPIVLGDERLEFRVLAAKLGKLPLYLFEHRQLFEGRFPYGDENGPYVDNWRRYGAFAKAVLASIPHLDFAVDVLHCMDWTCGLVPLFHKLEHLSGASGGEATDVLARAGTFFSFNNLAMQGAFEREILARLGIPHELFRFTEGVELGGKVNFLKAGAEFATVLCTHSPTHAEVIQQQDRGYGLEDVFQRRKKELLGIHNGVDYQAWDPSRDPLLAANFSAADEELVGKKKCKAALQQDLGLDVAPRTLLACHVGRWDADSGFDLLSEVLGALLEHNIELVVMGAGSEEVQKRLRTVEATFPGRLKVLFGYDPSAAHRLLAGADLLLMPSHYQPANSLFAVALRYGAAPLIYAQSGLESTVEDAMDKPESGIGFHFSPYVGEGLLEGIVRVLGFYKDSNAWKALVLRLLSQDFSWDRAAAEYLKAYRRVTRRIRGR